MTDHRIDAPGENGAPIPRDLPDQQATEGEDPWEVAPGKAAGDTGRRDGSTEAQSAQPMGSQSTPSQPAEATDSQETQGPRESEEPREAEESRETGPSVPDTDVPDTDEAGTGREGAPYSGSVHPEQPVPDEPSG